MLPLHAGLPTFHCASNPHGCCLIAALEVTELAVATVGCQLTIANSLFLCWLQVIHWVMGLADGDAQTSGFRPAGFERFERIWTGQQVGP